MGDIGSKIGNNIYVQYVRIKNASCHSEHKLDPDKTYCLSSAVAASRTFAFFSSSTS